MSIKYKLLERANPQKRDEKKWYAISVPQGVEEQREIAKTIASKSSLTSGDVYNNMENLVEELPKILAKGRTVKLGDFGSFRISISSEGAPTKEEFNVNMIKKSRIIFTPGKALREALEHLHYEKE